MWWTSLLLTVAALAAATAPRLSRALRFYLCWQVVAIPVTEITLHLFCWKSPYYTAVYVLGSVIARFLSLYILESVGSHWGQRLVALSFATFAGWMAYRHMDGVRGLEPVVLLPEGTAFVFLGMALGFQAPFHKDRQVLVPLAVMWLLLGVFDFGILMHNSETWTKITDMGSYWVAITAFAWVALSRWMSETPSHKTSHPADP